MAKKYPGGVLVATAFKMNDPQPIVDYMVVELLDDLDTLPNQFNGMLVFVEEDQQNWLKKAIGWVPASQQINTSIFRTKLEQKVLSYTFESTVNSLLLTQETGYYFDSYGLIQTINFLLKIEDDFFLYDGREHTFINMQATAIRFKHLFATENPLALKFFFPDEEDFILLPKQSIKIKWIAYLNTLVLVANNSIREEVTQRTGTVVKFDKTAIYGTLAAPVSGNITVDETGARLGMIQEVIHNSATVPTFGTGNVEGEYQPGINNSILYKFYGTGNVYVKTKAL